MIKARKKSKKSGGVFPHFIPGQKSGHPVEKLLLSDSPYNIYDTNKYNFDIITDDRPFPFDVYRDHPHLKQIAKQIIILVLVPAFIVWGIRRRFIKVSTQSIHHIQNPGLLYTCSAYTFFSLLGIGYLLIEVVLIQHLQIFLGMPVLTMAVVLGTMLFFSGLGSYSSGNWKNKNHLMVFFGIIAYAIVLSTTLPWIVDTYISLSLFMRVLIVISALAPISFLMGIPFPFGMKLIRNNMGDKYGTAMFAINGAFSALAIPLSLSLATIYGYKFTYMTGITAYILCLALALLLLQSARTTPSIAP